MNFFKNLHDAYTAVLKTSPCCPCRHVTIEFGLLTRLSLKMFVVMEPNNIFMVIKDL